MPIKPNFANSPIQEIRILTEKGDLRSLYAQLHDEYEIAEFGDYQGRISYDVSNAMKMTPDSFVAVAYGEAGGESNRVLCVRTGFIVHEEQGMNAHIGWTVRRQSDELRGYQIGLDLIYASNKFLKTKGVNSVFTTASGRLGKTMIEKSGGRKLAPHECQHVNKTLPEYVWELTKNPS